MSDITDDDYTPEQELYYWEWSIKFAESTGDHARAAELREAGPPPMPRQRTSLVIDTGLENAPSDIIALAIAARRVPKLALVTTPDDERGTLLRWLLDSCERPDITVTSSTTAAVEAMEQVFSHGDGLVDWLGMSSLHRLEAIIERIPTAGSRLDVTQLLSTNPGPMAEDPEGEFELPADAGVLTKLDRAPLVTAKFIASKQNTFALTPLLSQLDQAPATPWITALRTALQPWAVGAPDRTYPATGLLALASERGAPFIDFELQRRRANDGPHPDGYKVFYVVDAPNEPFQQWINREIDIGFFGDEGSGHGI